MPKNGASSDGSAQGGRRAAAAALTLAVAAAACTVDGTSDANSDSGAASSTTAEATAASRTGAPGHPDDWPGIPEVPTGVYDPIAAGETPPDGFRQVIPRDGILPVYVPTFVGPEQVDWPDDELVIGVDIEGEARAYPVGFLTRREIVNDIHRGIPTFVTW